VGIYRINYKPRIHGLSIQERDRTLTGGHTSEGKIDLGVDKMLVVGRYAEATCIRKRYRMVPGSSPSDALYMGGSCSMHTRMKVGNAQSFIGYQVPHSQIPIHPTPLSACLCCTSIPIPKPTSSHIQCQSDQHYYAH